MSNLSSASSTALVVHEPAPLALDVATDFSKAKKYLQLAGAASAQSLANQVLCGQELKRLKKEYGIKRGGDRRSNPSAAGLKTWEELLDEHVGISPDSAERYIKMADGSRKRIDNDEIAALLDLPLASLSDDQFTALFSAVNKITDGFTQLEFLRELGFAKKPQGSGAKGGDTGANTHPGPDAPVKPFTRLTPAEQTYFDGLTNLQRRAYNEWAPLIQKAHEAMRKGNLAACADRELATLRGLLADLTAALRGNNA